MFMELNKKITRERMSLFLEKNKTKVNVLDVGSGGSCYNVYFPNRTTFDIDELRSPDIVGDIHKMPFQNEQFDVVLCTEVFEHLKNPFKAAQEIKRVLKNNGKLVLTTRFIFPIHDSPNDFFRYTKYGLKEIFKDWKDVVIIEEAETVETISILLQRLIFQVDYKFNNLIKVLFLVLIKLFLCLNKFKLKEFGEISKKNQEKTIMSSGYYLVANK